MSTKGYVAYYQPEYDEQVSAEGSEHNAAKCIMLYKTKTYQPWFSNHTTTKVKASASVYSFVHDENPEAMLTDLTRENNRAQYTHEAAYTQTFFKSQYYLHKMAQFSDTVAKENLVGEIARTTAILCNPKSPKIDLATQSSLITAAKNVSSKPEPEMKGQRAFNMALAGN